MTTTPSTSVNDTLPEWVDTPGTEAYEAAVAPWNLALAPRPLGVVTARSADDVAAAVRLASRLGITVTVQATGHGVTSAMATSLLISTRAMTSLVIDPARRVAVVGAGVLWSQVLDAAAPHGLAGLAGSAPHVGVVGYTAGGGVGPLVRTYGLACDRVRAIEVVTGDGELRRATASENPDLFWALRGGRGLVGVITSIEFELLPIADLYGGAVYFDGDDAAAVLHRWASWSADLPPEATTSVALLRLPAMPGVPTPLAGRLTVAVRFAFIGDAQAGKMVLAPMRQIASPLVDTVDVMPYAALGAIHADPVDPMPSREDHALLGELTPDAIKTLLALAGPGTDTPQVIVEIRQLGGAISNGTHAPSAFSSRHAHHSLMMIGLGVPPMAHAVASHAAAVLTALRPWVVSGGLPTFAPREGRPWLERTYDAETLDRLATVSRAYDPASTIHGSGDLIVVPQSVTPTIATSPRAGATLLRSVIDTSDLSRPSGQTG